MKNIFIKVSLLLIIILLSCNLVFYFFKVPELRDKISKSEADYTELYQTNEECQFGYIQTLQERQELENQIATHKATIEEKDKAIADKDAQIKKLNQEIANLKK